MRLIDADALRDNMQWCIDHDMYDKPYDYLAEIDDAPTANEWIPVYKGLPEKGRKTYLVQTDSGYMCSCRWTDVNPFWTELTTEWHWNRSDIPQYSKVVAWMDLEPYTENGGGEE